ncbi:RagB/SusD family nutrient uptake outer membrane protein [Algibacter sp. 2305UL17-15]|uniref:RagB/SusD family nutrient uptake outer membrane protein n=1 Tax=Algibacter sp. 2305UL17-15 TaxID=3231268 RepID=UPI0034582EA1
MKKTIFKKMVFLLVSSVVIFGCAEDFLEETNPIQLSTDSFWKNLNDLNTGLTAVYNSLKDGNTTSIANELNRSDMTYPGFGRPNATNEYWLQTFNNSSSAPNGKWASLYRGIFRANQVLEAAERLYPDFSAETKEDADIVIGQARALRGLFYFYLHSGFNRGAVPIFDFVPRVESEFYESIQPASVVQEFFRADLEYAITVLPKSYDSGQEGRITGGAAIALLAKSYLYEGDYPRAAALFKLIIDEGPYSLTPDIGSNFTTRDEFNEESILEIGYSLNYKNELPPFGEDQNSNTLNFVFSPANVGGWRSTYPALWLNLKYQRDPLDMQDPRNTVTRIRRMPNGLPALYAEGELDENGVARSQGEIKMDVDVPRIYSLRTSASIALVGDWDTDYYGLPTPQGTLFNNNEHSYWRKYTNWDITRNEKSISNEVPRSGVNVRLIRLADVYLMYAECLISGGTNNAGVEEALVYINRVRRRSGVRLLGMTGTGEYPVNDHDDVQYTANTLMEHLMYVERPLELSAEGNAIRTIDLRRWGITKARFKELSERVYYNDHFKYEDEDGDPKTRWNSVVSDEPTPLSGDEPFENWTEFVQAAANYVEGRHAYWPVPNSEETANPKLYGAQ